MPVIKFQNYQQGNSSFTATPTPGFPTTSKLQRPYPSFPITTNNCHQACRLSPAPSFQYTANTKTPNYHHTSLITPTPVTMLPLSQTPVTVLPYYSKHQSPCFSTTTNVSLNASLLQKTPGTIPSLLAQTLVTKFPIYLQPIAKYLNYRHRPSRHQNGLCPRRLINVI